MKKLLFLFVAFCSLLTSTSCDQQLRKKRLARIDSLESHLNGVQDVLNNVDSVLLENRIRDIDQTSNWVYDNITDTLSAKPGLLFGDYMRSKKYLGQALTRYKDVRNELIYSKKQINTLRTDVQNGFYSQEEFKAYFDVEATSISKLNEAADELQSNYEMSTERYQKFKPGVNQLVDSIKSVIYAREPISK